jgi:sporulation protein YlmC with PRC-barrel domain
MTPTVLSASSITSDDIRNPAGEDLGSIKDLMIDLTTGNVRFAVVSFGGFLGVGDKLFAVPFTALTVDPDNNCFILDADKESLERAPGFDKYDWPDFADTALADTITSHYQRR